MKQYKGRQCLPPRIHDLENKTATDPSQRFLKRVRRDIVVKPARELENPTRLIGRAPSDPSNCHERNQREEDAPKDPDGIEGGRFRPQDGCEGHEGGREGADGCAGGDEEVEAPAGEVAAAGLAVGGVFAGAGEDAGAGGDPGGCGEEGEGEVEEGPYGDEVGEEGV